MATPKEKVDILAPAILSLIREISPDGGITGPAAKQYRAAAKERGVPGPSTARSIWGKWSSAVEAAGLIPVNQGRRRGEAARPPTPIQEVDAGLFAEKGWDPTDPQALTRLANLPPGGLMAMRKITEPVWDWRRQDYVMCDRYLLK